MELHVRHGRAVRSRGCVLSRASRMAARARDISAPSPDRPFQYSDLTDSSGRSTSRVRERCAPVGRLRLPAVSGGEPSGRPLTTGRCSVACDGERGVSSNADGSGASGPPIPSCSSIRPKRQSICRSSSLSVGTPGFAGTPSRSRARSAAAIPGEASEPSDRSPAVLVGLRTTSEIVPASTSGCSSEVDLRSGSSGGRRRAALTRSWSDGTRLDSDSDDIGSSRSSLWPSFRVHHPSLSTTTRATR
jgi:hypothetical protein